MAGHSYTIERAPFNARALLEAIGSGVVAVNNCGVIVYINSVAAALFQVHPQVAVQRPVMEVFPAIGERLMSSVKNGLCCSGLTLREQDLAVVVNVSPILDNDQTTGAICLFKEVSELEQVLTELDIYRRMHRQLDAIFESSYDGLFVTDGQGTILRLNRSSAKLNGYIQDKVVGKNIRDMVCDGFIDRSVTLEVLEKKVAVSIMQRLKNGKMIIVTGTPVFDEEGSVEFVVTNERDIGMLNLIRTQLREAQCPAKIHISGVPQVSRDRTSISDFVAFAGKTKEILNIALAVANFDSTILITGESGVGKGLLAKLIHGTSSRKNSRLVRIDCGSIPEPLLESELFGYRRGAFTGADSLGKPGRVLAADRGTLLLDEIGEVIPTMQVKLLRLLEDKEIVPIGDTESRKIDTRVIATTNRDLKEMLAKGLFRKDLYYRLNIVPIHIPPLRDRPEDIPPLIWTFLARLNARLGCNKRVAPEVVDILSSYSFPGNVRELENLIERLVVLCPEEEIQTHHLPEEMISSGLPENLLEQELPLREAVAIFERQLLSKALSKYGSKAKAAKALQVDPATMVRKARKYRVGSKSEIVH